MYITIDVAVIHVYMAKKWYNVGQQCQKPPMGIRWYTTYGDLGGGSWFIIVLPTLIPISREPYMAV